MTEDNVGVDRITRAKRYEKLLERWERRPQYAALAVALVVAMLWMLVDRGVPAAVEVVAMHIPVEAEATLGRETLRALDEGFLQPSELAAGRQASLRSQFAAMAAKAGDTTPYTLEFRKSAFGANAFALPAGIIIMTDELVALAKADDEIIGVLAHELGHVRGRHTMRRLLEGSISALIIAGVTGDVASTTSLAAAAPALLLQTRYSRDNEREADAHAVESMRAAGLDAAHLGRILVRLERTSERGPGLPSFLSTHPPSADRQALTQDGSDEAAQALAKGQPVNFAGLWKEECSKMYGLQFKPVDKAGVYAVSLCGPAGCLDSGTHRPQTTVQGDSAYEVLSPEEIFIRDGLGHGVTYLKCGNELMDEMPDG
jgi:Zn-dependent protease with chaperone function